MKKVSILYLLVLFLLFCLSACGNPQDAASEPPATTAATETTSAPVETEPTGPVLLKDAVDGKVCVSFIPTQAGQWRYAEIPNQEAAVAAFEKATGAIYSDEWWIKGDKTVGLTVVYKGEFWDFVDSGELVCATGRVRAEDAADLLALCTEAARDAGWTDAVTPEQLQGIQTAVLHQGDVEFSLNDPQKLAALEQMLTAGKFSLGGTGCPFSVLLTVTVDSGEELTIALAADSCGVWMSEGNYYEFSHDSQPLYDLFGATVPYGTLSVK